MNNAALEKKLTSKEFLKSNDLVEFVTTVLSALKNNKVPLAVGLVIILLAGLSMPAIRWYRLQQVTDFSDQFYKAKKGLKKEEAFKELLSAFPQLKASQIVRLELIDTLLTHDNKDEAMVVTKNGIIAGQRDIFNTLLVMRYIDTLKQDKKFTEAATFAGEHQKDVLVAFANHVKFIQADLLVLADKKADARKMYQALSTPEGVGIDAKGSLSEFDPEIAERAKEKVLLLDMGLL